MEKVVKVILNILFVVMFLNLGLISYSKPFENPVKSAINEADISSSALIGVSFKEVDTGKVKFQMNSTAPMSAASVQKLVTVIPAINTLGADYKFNTTLYRKGDNLYLKLSADPYLTSKDLKNMFASLNMKKVDNFYIDETVLDNVEWGEGWQWDNDLNYLMPKFSSYNLDKNLITINLFRTKENSPVEIGTNVFYPLTFMNNAITGKKNSVTLEKYNYISPDIITVKGEINKDTDITIPVNYPKRYFILRLEDAMRNKKVPFYSNVKFASVPKDAVVVAQVSHTLNDAVNSILKQSDNMVAETVFKLAGGKYINGSGTEAKAERMFEAYYLGKGIDTTKVKIVDGSGVSKNNLLTADFITEVLVKDYTSKNAIKNFMAEPSQEGTLANRMMYFQNNLKAKTGTLTNVSALAGYITAESGKTYAFAILTNDPKSKSADKKAFEEYVLRKAYRAF